MPQMHQPKIQIRRAVAMNTVSQLVGRAVSSLSTLIVTLFVARSFGANGFGDFVKVITFVSFFYLLADFGLNATYLQRTVSASDSEKTGLDSEWSVLVGLRLLISIVLVVAGLLLVGVIPSGIANGYTQWVKTGIVLFLPSIIFQSVITSGNALFQRHLRYDLSSVAVSLGSILTVCIIWLIYTGILPHSLYMTIFSLLLGGAFTAVLGLGLSSVYFRESPLLFNVSRYRGLLLSAVPLGLTLIFNVIFFHIDSVILTFTRQTAEVGIYGMAYKFFEVPLVIPTFFMNAVYPVMLQSMGSPKDYRYTRLRNLYIKSALVLFAASIGLLIVTWWLAPLLILVRSDFAASIPVLRVLGLGFPFFFLSSLSMWTLITMKKQMLLMWVYGFSMVINILFNLMYIPSYGYMAAAWITIASEALVLFSTSGAVVYVLKSSAKSSSLRV